MLTIQRDVLPDHGTGYVFLNDFFRPLCVSTEEENGLPRLVLYTLCDSSMPVTECIFNVYEMGEQVPYFSTFIGHSLLEGRTMLVFRG